MSEKKKQHEYLLKEDYYESRSVGTKARKVKKCEHCGEKIIQGQPHQMHHFYPEFNAVATHLQCSKGFIESLRDKPLDEEEDE